MSSVKAEGHCRRLLCFFLLLPWQAFAQCEADTTKKFHGISINLLGIHWGEGFLLKGIQQWENQTGGKIGWTKVTSTAELERQITDDLKGAGFYDGYICTNKMVPTWASQGWLMDLNEAVRDPDLEWSKILPIFREVIAVYDTRVVTVPWDGDILMTYYRRDLAEKDGWEPPKTWEDFVDIAKMYEGKDLNEDGVPDYGACIASDPTEPSSFYHWITPFLTMAQTKGSRQGAFLKLTDDGVAQLVDNEAFRYTIDIMKRSQGNYPIGKGQTYGKARREFAEGKCSIYITWPSGGPWTIQKDPDGNLMYIHGRMGVASLPGSPKVLDWSTGSLVPCSPELCPYALDPKTGAYDGINRVAWYANGGMGTVVNDASAPERKAAMVDFLFWYAKNVDVTKPSPYNPFRVNHFDPSTYTASGWNLEDAQQYVGAEQEILNGPYSDNAVLDFRLPFASVFFQTYNELYPALLQGNAAQLEANITAVAQRVTNFIEVFFGDNVRNPVLPGKLELERIYRGSLGLAMRRVTQMCPSGTGFVETNEKLHTGECRVCSGGSYSPGGENQRCLNCAGGFATDKPQSALCTTCTSGKFAPHPPLGAARGALTCEPCPPNTVPGVTGQDICKCKQGFYGNGGRNCNPCPKAMTTPFPGTKNREDCVCDVGWYLDTSGCERCPALHTTAMPGASSPDECTIEDVAVGLIVGMALFIVLVLATGMGVRRYIAARLRKLEELHTKEMETRVADGLDSIREARFPMVLIDAPNFIEMSQEELSQLHETSRDRGKLTYLDTRDDIKRFKNGHRIVFFSYEWWSWKTPGPHPEHFKLMKKSLMMYSEMDSNMPLQPSKREEGPRVELDRIYVWLDVLSIPQRQRAIQSLAVNSLYAYAIASDVMIIIAPDVTHDNTGDKLSLNSYKKRMWTRVEQFAQIATSGIGSIFIADESTLRNIDESWAKDVVCVFDGAATCCRLCHAGKTYCDKELLVTPFLGLWYQLSSHSGAEKGSAIPQQESELADANVDPGGRWLFDEIGAIKDKVFPSTIEFVTDSKKERRALFGDLIDRVDNRVRAECKRQPATVYI